MFSHEINIITTRKAELFDIDADEPEMLYAILSKLPRPLDIEALVARTVSLFSQHPPETLPFGAWRSVSSYSVLKTTRNQELLAKQTLADGERYLSKHANEIERSEQRNKMVKRANLLLRKYQRPAGSLAIAVLVGILSFWLGRSGGLASIEGLQWAWAGVRNRLQDLFGWTITGVQ
ncbi:hypothetical protein MBLNU459_g7952t1 [Dothideomycetes sp. NU459]